MLFQPTITVWNVSIYGVFSGPYFSTFGLNAERYFVPLRIHSECGKIRTRKNSVFGHISRCECISKIKVKEFVFIPLFPCIFICIICIYYVCLYLSVLIYKYMADSWQWGHWCVFSGTFFWKKRILLAHTPQTDAIWNHF